MKEINFEAIKRIENLTVGDLMKMFRQSENLPEGFKMKLKEPEEEKDFAEKLVEEIKELFLQ
jgi:hypothetical protein